ncbi:MAG: hypothetical protein IPM56_16280 [Ignavibacteriales bacterium]|nr:MAG: hypothetical protein IPM56_16280 [Ignavibacteriales bacterium]
MSVINVKFRTPTDKFHFIINVTDGDSKTYNYDGIELEPFEYGNDEDLETIIYPESVTIKFSLLPDTGSIAALDNRYVQLGRSLRLNETNVTINKNGQEHLLGFIDGKTVSSTYKNKVFQITVLSNFHKLKDIDPRTLDPNDFTTPVDVVVGPGGQVLFVDLVLKLIQLVYPSVNQVILVSNIKSQTSYTILGEPWIANAQYFGDFSNNYIGSISTFTTAAQIIKEVCANFASVGILKDRKFYIQSRFYQSQSAVVLSKELLADDAGPEPIDSTRFDGLQVIVTPAGTSAVYEELYGEVIKDENGNVKNSDNVETIQLIQQGGYPPGNEGFPLLIRNLWIYVPGFVSGIGNTQFTSSLPNSFFIITGEAQKPLWKCVADAVWALIQKDRVVFGITMSALSWTYDTWYVFENTSVYLRARKMFYDEMKTRTRMELIDG